MKSTYQNYSAQSIIQPKSGILNDSKNNQLALVQSNAYKIQLSPLLPQSVISTIFNKNQTFENYQTFINTKKAELEKDMDNFLKEIIFLFEDLKSQFFLKIEDQVNSFQKVFDQFEKITVDCSDWAEQKIGSANFQNEVRSSASDLLYQGLSQARYQKQKADEIEKSLLAIKQKIDNSKLNELNEEIKLLSNERNQNIYVSEEARAFYDDLKVSLKTKISQLNQSRIVPPFNAGPSFTPPNFQLNFYDQNVREPKVQTSPSKSPDLKTNLSDYLQQVVNKEKKNGNIGYKTEGTMAPQPENAKINSSNYSIKEGAYPRLKNEAPKCGIIAQQNQFYSDEILLTNPTIRQEKELAFKVPTKINTVLSLINNIVLFGSEDGTIIIMNIGSNIQTIVRAHTAPIKGLTKANESLILSSSMKPDLRLLLWDFGSIVMSASPTDGSPKPQGSVLLVGTLKGMTDSAVGHAFISENIILAVGEDGQILVWDWRTNSTIAQFKIEHSNLNSFVLFTDRDSFAVGTTDGFVLAYNILKEGQDYSFVKQSEMKEQFPIVTLYCFRGNNDIIIAALSTGDIKLIGRRERINYQTLTGCKSPISFFVLNSVKNESNVYLMCLEPYGFKLVDIDSKDFAFITTQSVANFKFEKSGWPNWQIVDSIPKEKITFITINNANKPSTAILWSLNAGK